MAKAKQFFFRRWSFSFAKVEIRMTAISRNVNVYCILPSLNWSLMNIVRYTIPMCHVPPGNWEDCTFLELAQWHDGIGAVSPVAIELHQDNRRRRKSAVCRYAEEPQAEVLG